MLSDAPRVALIAVLAGMAPAWAGAAEAVSFGKEIVPVLLERCVTCHGPEKQKGAYRVDTYAHLAEPGESGRNPIAPRHPEASHLFQLLTAADPDERMPKKGEPLSDETLERFRRWIADGAALDGGDPTNSLSEWNAGTPHPASPEVYAFPVPVRAMAFLRGGELMTGGYHELLVWNQAGRLTRRVPGLPRRLSGLAAAPDGSRLFYVGGTPGRAGEAGMVDLNRPDPPAILCRASDELLAVAVSDDGLRVAVAGTDRTIRVFDGQSGGRLRSLEGHADWVTDLGFSRDGRRLATASRDRTARVFDLESGEMVCAYRGHSESVNAVLFLDGVDRMASASRDGRLHLWGVGNASDTKAKVELPGEITRLVAYQGRLFSACADGKVREHQPDDLKTVREFGPLGDRLLSVALRPDGALMAAASHAGEVQTWQFPDGNPVADFKVWPR